MGGVAVVRGPAVRYRCLFALACACGGVLLLLSASPRPLLPPRPTPAVTEPAHTIATTGCTIPLLTPFDKSVEKFARAPVRIKPCRNLTFNFTLFNTDNLLAYNDSHIWIQRDNIIFDTASFDVNIMCCYSSFYRPSAVADVGSLNVDDRVKYEPCVYFTEYIEVMNEFVRVTCDFENKTIFMQYFAFATMKPLMPNIYGSEEAVNISKVKSAPGYNVLVLGIDAVSRLNFYRTMPKTLDFLKKRGAIEMLGYNKVGDNTFPNLVPMLLGIKMQELKKTCLPNSRATFDNCPFVWEWFKDAGYYTALGEDSAWLGTFNFERIGFINTPTEYYLHTFIHEAEAHVANNKDFNTEICMGKRYFFNVLLDYVKSLTRTLSSSKLFGFFWEVTMSHDHVNYPVIMDHSYEKFLKELEDSKYLDNTVVFILSDHGIRWGGIRFTKQGRLEERLPLLHILLPPSFVEKYHMAHENLLINSHRLTTPFDMHATLSDLANLASIEDENIRARCRTHYALERGISLFLEVTSNRTCAAAGIDDHWCTCHREKRLPTDSVEAHEAAVHLMRHLNALLAPWTQCVRLKLAEVLGAVELQAGTPQPHEVGWSEYTVTARAHPGGGVFEATLRRDARKGTWSASGAVSRLNLYGAQSRCVHDAQIKLYCYCK